MSCAGRGRASCALNFAPESSGKVESVSIISDRELSSVASGATKQADSIFGIKGDGVSESRKRRVAEDL